MPIHTLTVQVLQRQPLDPEPLPPNTVVIAAARWDDYDPIDRVFRTVADREIARVRRDAILEHREHHGESLVETP